MKYRKSLLGMLWTVLIPAGSALVYYSVFRFVMKVQIENYLLLILTGIIPWTFFSSSISSGLESIVTNHSLLNKVPLPIHALVYSEILTHMLNFILSLPVIIFVFLIGPLHWKFTMLQFPLIIFFLFIQSYSVSLILGLGFVYFRDLRYITQLVLQFWFYLTPIMYHEKMIPPQYVFLLNFNPLGTLFSALHKSIVDQIWLDTEHWISLSIWTFLLFLISIYMLRKLQAKVIEIL